MKWYRKALCRLGFHNWIVIKTEWNQYRLCKKLAEINGWGSEYKINYYQCSICKQREEVYED